MRKIGILVGSLRKESFSKKIASHISGLFPDNFTSEIVDISKLEIYNQDFDDEGTPPESYKIFREKIKTLDGFIFISPEYNRSISAVLKNALDVGSRPYGQSLWNAKPSGIISTSTGRFGGFGANNHLRQSMMVLNVPMLQQPEAYIGEIESILDAKGNVVDEQSISFLKRYIEAYTKWVTLILG